MHRVELKEWLAGHVIGKGGQFLMHRVELKASENTTSQEVQDEVPNAPCGVERGSIVVGSFIRPCS